MNIENIGQAFCAIIMLAIELTHMTLWLCATSLILSCANYITVQIKIIVVCANYI